MNNVAYALKSFYLLGKGAVLVVAVILTLPLTIFIPELGVYLGDVLVRVGVAEWRSVFHV